MEFNRYVTKEGLWLSEIDVFDKLTKILSMMATILDVGIVNE